MMSARLWLLALLAACLRSGSTESDHLPAALVELVKSGSVSSAEDLQLLLLSVSADDDPESFHANNTTNRLPRSLLDAQPAQQALCKVRTEVMEVTRSMLDRSNANFLLWPPCVEVQRCSGCCNTKSLKCVPVLTHTRYLQVMKIQYSNMRPVYDKAIVSVNDHVECRCQPAPRPTPRRKSAGHKQEVRERTGKPRYKEDLHRRDELKHNQRLQLEDLLAQSWPLVEHQPNLDPPATGFLSSENLELHIEHNDFSSNKTLHQGSRDHYHGDGRQHNNTRVAFNEKSEAPLPNHTEREEEQARSKVHNVTKSEGTRKENVGKVGLEIQKNATISGKMLTNQTLENEVRPTQITNQTPHPQSERIDSSNTESTKSQQSDESHFQAPNSLNKNQNESQTQQSSQTHEGSSQKQRDMFIPAEDPYEKQRGNGMRESEKSEEELDIRRWSSTEEKEELLTLSQNLDEENYNLPDKQKEDHKQYSLHHKHEHSYTTPKTTETTSRTPVRASRPHTPPRAPPRPLKRRRKQRNRISKAAMRAMLM